jgi:ribosomal protein S12 methylthiotransferase
MKRPAAAEDTLARIAAWRRLCPELALRSTFIVGFPGETERDFEMLLEFLREAALDRVGCFTYSAVEGAPANALPDAVPEEVKQERWERFMAAQQEISRARLADRIGSTLEILVDSVDGNTAIGRSYADAPDIDGVVHVDEVADLTPGRRATVVIEGADDYDLFARQVVRSPGSPRAASTRRAR